MISEVVISTVRRKSILIKDWLDAFLSIFFPRCCLVCGGVLAKGEECLCARCNMDLPRTNYHQMKDNPVEKLFWGKIPLERATSYFFYRRGGDTRAHTSFTEIWRAEGNRGNYGAASGGGIIVFRLF